MYPAHCTSLHSAPGENNLGWIKEEDIGGDGAYYIGIAHGAVEGETIDNEGAYFLMKRAELESIPVDAWLIGHTHVPFPKNLKAEEYTACEKIFNAGTHVQTDVACNTEGQCFIIEIAGNKAVKAKKFISGNNPIYDSRDNCNAIIETATNKLVMGCKETVIPTSVLIIGDSAFASFDAITSFVIPEGITEIEEGAFSYCFNLKSITLPESLEKLGNSAFYFCRSLKKIKIPSNIKEFHICVFSNCLSLSELVIHDNLIAIGGIDSLWSYRCDIRKVLGSPKSIAKSLAEQCRWEYVETK